jgi:hypothetical protein
MDPRWRQIVYWGATILAALIVLSVVWSYISNVEDQYPVFPVARLILAGVIWLAGWAFRYFAR